MAEKAANDINIPPAQDSLKNIVNILNDDCLQLILLKLDKVWDFWRAAEVCTRFQENAKICFPFKEMIFFYSGECFVKSKNNYIHFNQAENFLKLFSHKIKSISCYLYNGDNPVKSISLISKYCWETLIELKMMGTPFDQVYELEFPFEALEKLHVDGTHGFKNPNASFPNLKNLKISLLPRTESTLDWIANNFSKLEQVSFGITDLSTDLFIEFQNRNPQLKNLIFGFYIGRNPTFSSLIWKNIENRLPNIEYLFLQRVPKLCTEDIAHIGNLRCLKKLHLITSIKNENKFDLIPIKSLFSSSVKNTQPLEELNIDFIDKELGEIISNLKTIKSLYIGNDSDDVLSEIARNLPNLEYCIDYGCDLPFGITNLRKANGILKYCKNLIKLDTLILLGEDRSGSIGLNDFIFVLNSIVALASAKHVKVSIFYKKENLNKHNKNILGHILDTKEEWVRFVDAKEFGESWKTMHTWY